jgi:hypothetical protein
MIDSYLTHEMQRLLQTRRHIARDQQRVSQNLPRLHAARTANKYAAEEVLTAQ